MDEFVPVAESLSAVPSRPIPSDKQLSDEWLSGAGSAMMRNMAIYRLLQNSAFDPDMIKCMTDAYEEACRVLKLAGRSAEPTTELVARKIVEIAQTGVKDPAELRRRALDELGIPAP